jgi:hypothetical protein
MPSIEIPVQTQHNADGSLSYLKYKYKGSVVKIQTDYDSQGNLIGVSIPQFLNIPHAQLFQIISAMFIHGLRKGQTNWYDRNAKSIAFNYDHLDTPPVVGSIVWTYTCPPYRKAFVECLMVSIRRTVASAPYGFDAAGVFFQPKGATGPNLVLYRSFFDNTLGAGSEETVAQNMLMQEGDILAGTVFEGSTGGAIQNHVAAKITEFDT